MLADRATSAAPGLQTTANIEARIAHSARE
jgi:hypothetical protein